jgi:pimeloyl-ACP methyl ester carboxylesterase
MTAGPGPDRPAPWVPDPRLAPAPDPVAEPEGFLVTADDGTRLHFHDWGGAGGGPAVVLVPGLLAAAWTWAPAARRLIGKRRVVVADLRGHGLSDAPPDGYDLDTLAADLVVVAEGSGALDGGAVVVAGHGFGGAVAAAAAARLGERCAGLVLVDGGWERTEITTDVDVDEFLRGLEEPPEVLRSMDAWLADRRAFDPATWDADQERIARDSVVATAAGHLVRSVRPHVVEAMVRTMFAIDPAPVIAAVQAPVAALVALAGGEWRVRMEELDRAAEARRDAGRRPLLVAGFPTVGHNLMRYVPAPVTAAILAIDGSSTG